MAASIPDLWSDDIKVDILTPLAILRTQADLLSRKTKGLLEAEVTTTTSDKAVQHNLDLIAPALNHYRHRVLTAQHSHDLIYPVIVAAECFQPPKPRTVTDELLAQIAIPPNRSPDWRPRAATEQDFLDLERQVLRSGEVRSIIQSLIARSNEQRSASAASPSTTDDGAQG